MDKITVIGLTGKARSGKDTAAEAIRDRLNEYNDTVAEFTEVYVVGYEAFAAPLKSMVAMLLDFFGKGSIMAPAELYPYIDGDKKEEEIEGIGASPRKLMQTLGTNWGRDLINKDLWLNCLRERVNAYNDLVEHGYKGAVVVIPDCRFDNEAELIRELGGKVVQIVRDEAPEKVGEEGHASEAGVSPHLVDLTVANNGTVEEFQAALIEALGDTLPDVPVVDDLPWDELEAENAEAEEEATDAVEERSEALA